MKHILDMFDSTKRYLIWNRIVWDHVFYYYGSTCSSFPPHLTLPLLNTTKSELSQTRTLFTLLYCGLLVKKPWGVRGTPFREVREGHQAKQVPKVHIKFHIVLCCFRAHPHLLVLPITERFLLVGANFGIGLASENHWLQQVLVLTVHRWPTPISVGGLSVKSYSLGSLGPSRALHSHKYFRPWTTTKITLVTRIHSKLRGITPVTTKVHMILWGFVVFTWMCDTI
jgi:hypothetical protein